ncbi:hypothetical protein [Mucilaginibacter sp.]|uniref:hypothetical protein n=1 Tax=Mucilaginibacter sp. TaxID=1882438 RepID=UPI003D136595
MELLLRCLIVLVLLLVFVQDQRSRAVHWLLFPLLVVLFWALKGFRWDWQPVAINLALLALQLALLSLYFSLRHGRLVNVTDGMLGWGDLLFLAATAFYFSVLNFLLFYILSLVIVLTVWLLWKPASKEIPLAGHQALLLAVLLLTTWSIWRVNLTDDGWLLSLSGR